MGCAGSNQAREVQVIDNPNILLKENTGLFKNDYSLKEQVGEGTYGVVRKCKHRRSGEERVVKRIHKKSLRKEEQKIKMANDVVFLRKIDHPNVVKPYEFYQDDEYFWIVTEIISGGDLIGRLEQKGLLTEREASNIIKQTLSVLSWCHEHQIMHRDLKPENIMIDSTSKKDVSYQIKVIDWGTAVQWNSKSQINDLVGTPYYIAPEVVSRSKPYNEKCDIWSLGAMLYTILSGDPQFYAEDIPQILQLVKEGSWKFEGDIWDTSLGGISASAKDLISKMMVKDPSKRLTAKQALEHEWVQNAPEQQVSEDVRKATIQKMHKFNAKNKFQTAVMMFITQQCSHKAERDQLTQAFRAIDKNNDGTLEKSEIIQYFKETLDEQQAEIECNQMIEKVDTDQNGLINYSEFLMATYQVQNEKSNESLKEAFKYFDQDNNGYITTQELENMIGNDMKDNNATLWDDIIKQADKDKDGQISFDEFKKMIDQMAEQQQQ